MYIEELIREISSRAGYNHQIFIEIDGKQHEVEIDNSEKDEVTLKPGKLRFE